MKKKKSFKGRFSLRHFKKGTAELYIIVGIATLAFFFSGGTEFKNIAKPTFPNIKQTIIFSPEKDKNSIQLQTFTVKTECDAILALNFLIDVSGSMRYEDKQAKEKAALRNFVSRLEDSSVIGIQTFSQTVGERVPISFLKDVRSQVNRTIDTLPADGATHTREGFLLAKAKLAQAIADKRFAGYKLVLIFISDGVPENAYEEENSQTCHVMVPGSEGNDDIRCFSKSQDPRIPTNIAQEIKNMGVPIYSIAITSNDKSDKALQPYLEALMRDAASKPDSQYYYHSPSGDNLSNIFENIKLSICGGLTT